MIWCGSGSTSEVWTAKQRIKEVGQPDAVGFRKQPEKRAVAVEAPRPAGFDDFQRRLAVAVEQFVAESSGSVLVGHLDGNRADPAHIADRDKAIRQDAFNGRAAGNLFKLRQVDSSLLSKMDFVNQSIDVNPLAAFFLDE